ncbi:TPA: HK97 family phage prohead protease [Streptococcus suis]|uniref:HK97 family phage prohead protease n=1 Tax=Streptococcus suis TaxID=1307 RepID=UPI00041B42A2|nr:HK97 family phage prohead protease [Streptococcus suis]QBX21092.1 head maturation protease [Streptococcus phage Javan553]WNO82458.1 HK97 family phage prohead protease [Streptococcus suis]HEL1761380.1 HK97 family phage prohead protease [Streptococcus suis]HEL1894152.1 HK97 family phage prohead protease [Streptococcus suis]HEM3168932.1 HK97 family phage prohead protease [Streptococcus suis 89-3576-3]
MERAAYLTRSFKSNLAVREQQEGQQEKVIEGYFAVYGSETELWPGAFEEIKIGAFDDTLDNDIRALINHNTELVLGRNKAGTLTLKVDDKGLWARVVINEQDTDALNLYARVQRGDVDQCSFGFNIVEESTEFREDGTVKWTIEKIDLHEVSIVTFPAYEATGVQARKRDFEDLQERTLESRKQKLKEKLNYAKTTHAPSQN